MGAAALGTLNVTVIGDIYGGRERSAALGPRLQLQRALRGHRELPCHRRRARDVRVVLPVRAAGHRRPDRHLLFSLRNPEPRNEQGLKEYFGSVWWHLADREVAGLVGVSLLTFVILFGPQLSYLPILMKDRFDAPTYVIGGVLSGASLTSALVSSKLGRLTGRFSE